MTRILIWLMPLLIITGSDSPLSRAQDGPKVADRATATRPLKSGDIVPDVTVKDVRGQAIPLSSVYRDKLAVLVFFRGGWCPICTKHTGELVKIYPQIKEMGAELVGISPDSPETSVQNVGKNAIPFPIFSDADVSAAKAFGIAFRVDSTTVERYKGFGIDLEKASGFSHHALPIPAVYIVDRSGKILYSHSDPNYRERLDPAVIIRELKQANRTQGDQ